MASSLLEKLLAAAGLRLRVAAGAWLPEVTLQQGANVTITELGNVVTIASSLAASTRVRANAAPYVSGDVTLLNGTNVTIVEDSGAKTLTINATGGGGGGAGVDSIEADGGPDAGAPQTGPLAFASTASVQASVDGGVFSFTGTRIRGNTEPYEAGDLTLIDGSGIVVEPLGSGVYRFDSIQ